VDAKRSESRCKARTNAGKACRAAATEGGLCFFHANPKKASELGRIGGSRNRHVAGTSADPLPTLDNAIAVRDTVARLIVDIYSGKLQPRLAAGLAPLLNLQLRAIEIADLEGRLARLEDDKIKIANLEGRLARLENAEAEKGSDGNRDALFDSGDPALPKA